jgi:catechol 2,3-dioxygenase-like lactoylglutathione lyase family enzyme
MLTLGLVTLVVPDYDAAIRFYVGVLGFELREDTPLDRTKRWVVVAPNAAAQTGLLLALAADDEQRARVGDQTGGRVAFFLDSDDFAADHARLLAAGVAFVEDPRVEEYGTVAVFEDPFGNRFDLIQPR